MEFKNLDILIEAAIVVSATNIQYLLYWKFKNDTYAHKFNDGEMTGDFFFFDKKQTELELWVKYNTSETKYPIYITFNEKSFENSNHTPIWKHRKVKNKYEFFVQFKQTNDGKLLFQMISKKGCIVGQLNRFTRNCTYLS